MIFQKHTQQPANMNAAHLLQFSISWSVPSMLIFIQRLNVINNSINKLLRENNNNNKKMRSNTHAFDDLKWKQQTFNDIRLVGEEPFKIKNYVNKYNYNFPPFRQL